MSNFKSAFASARKAGKKTFTWNGKSYTTDLRSDQAPAKSPRPMPRGSKPSAMTSSPSSPAAPKTQGMFVTPDSDLTRRATLVRKRQLGSAGGQKSRKR